MEIIRKEQTSIEEMRLNNFWEEEVYNQSHLKQSHQKKFTNAQLKPNILINAMMHNEKKYELAIIKEAEIIFKLVADQDQPIIKEKSSKEA